jgi:N-acetylglucosaminyldiphosphoundecaprenol N-acetyl-beta-D-mannosaminyltransferase
MSSFGEFFVAGVRIHAIRISDVVGTIDDWIRTRRRDYIVLTGAHGAVEMQRDAELRAINNAAGLTTPDGMPMVWLGRWFGFRHIEKVYAPDIMHAVFSVTEDRGYRHYLYGGKEGVADSLAAELRRRYPRIQIVGTYCPPFRPLTRQEADDVAASINDSAADIVWCGLGCPKQERWMHAFRPRLEAPVLIGVGAGFDFLSGRARLAPRWVQHSGFEWLFRTFVEPRRLIRRYARVVPRFALLALREMLAAGRRPTGKQHGP